MTVALQTAEQAPASDRARRGGRAGKRAGGSQAFEQPPFRQLRAPFPPTKLISDDELESIHLASLRVLKEIGVDVLHDEARRIMKAHGADVRDGSERVRFDSDMILELVAHAPAEFTLHARNPAHNVRIGGNNVTIVQVASAPNCSDLDNGRRPGNQPDFRNFLKLAQMHNIIHMTGGYPVEPVDIHPSVRHLECIRDLATLTDKVFHIYSLGKERNVDGIEIARIARGISREQLLEEPSVYTIINTNSPLKLDVPMMEGIIQMSSMGQAVIVTPFTLSGAMAPVTIAGALVQQNAEALSGLAFTQMVRKGAPVGYGGFTSNVDMKSGAPAFGTPEYMKAQLVGGQLARRYNIPYRSSNTCAANAVDAQAAYESAFSLWGTIQGGANVILHAAGWLEGGLRCSYEKTILDIDMLQMVAEFLTPLDLSEDALAIDAIRDVGPGGHFFGTQHTQDRYKNAFYSPIISDWRNFETWAEAGSPTAVEKANRVWKERLASYEEPWMDPAIREELNAFVDKRKAEGGAPTDF
ncbi:trimethylamine methyltransferase family protein [Aminobacter aganoensis]|uniref:Methyltransferase n=1 Tax=Aminobacter aganoensis TaxID=83264 RepID=A0A7X0F462_9HYPH|nr:MULTISPECIES: trimethylamine methyltransferase family protein [Aminobacter]KQU76151.1 methyltransferase [Aminobacter sp. DSM 101952]MBB6352757.1 trimethylamine--corrinoid protein Co-methyltransferase [Aminobacter aganoensis]